MRLKNKMEKQNKENKKEARKIIFALLVITLAFVIVSSGVSAYRLLCLENGQSVPSDDNPRYTCHHSICQVCVTDNNYPTHFGFCNSGACEPFGGSNATIDSEPPVITINNPINGSLFGSTSVLLDIDVDERADLEYTDLINGRGRWSRLCNSCTFYTKSLRFDEGQNLIRIRARDVVGNIAEKDLEFFVDSQTPKIRGTEPSKGFAGGEFAIEFDEANPSEIWLNYGISGNFKKAQVDTNGCVLDRRYYTCNVNVNLAEFDGRTIQYWFNMTDIAGNSATSRTTELPVDNSAPIIHSVSYVQTGRSGELRVNLTEKNLDTLEYIDNSDLRPRWKRLCSRITDGVCNGRTNFKDGDHEVEIRVIDLAGHETRAELNFFTDSKAPRIKSTSPSRGFANGEFFVEFDEANPASLWLSYGNSLTGMRFSEVPLNSCIDISRGTSCSINVNLNDYDGEKINYWFNITDIVGNYDESKRIMLDVDVTLPVINELNYSVDGRRVEFTMNITEQNFDVVEYIDNSDSRPRWKRLCSRLSNGICESRLSLREGSHDIDVQVFDDAGNIAGQNVVVVV